MTAVELNKRLRQVHDELFRVAAACRELIVEVRKGNHMDDAKMLLDLVPRDMGKFHKGARRIWQQIDDERRDEYERTAGTGS